MENFKTVTRGNSRDTSDTSSDASRNACWICGVRTGTAFMSGFGRTSHESVIKPCRALGCRYPVNRVAVRSRRHGHVANRQARPRRFPASRSKRRSRWQGHIGRCGSNHRAQAAGSAGRSAPLKRAAQTTAPAPVRSWRRSPSLREPAATAPTVAKQASNTATNPGMDAPGRGHFTFRQHAETYATSRPTRSAGRPDCSWPGDNMKSGGIAAACYAGGKLSGEKRSGRRTQAIRTSLDHTAADVRFGSKGDPVTRRAAAPPRGLSSEIGRQKGLSTPRHFVAPLPCRGGKEATRPDARRSRHGRRGGRRSR